VRTHFFVQGVHIFLIFALLAFNILVMCTW